MGKSSGNPDRPRVLLLHGETTYFGGAQKMLAYFLQGAPAAGLEPVVAMAPNPAMREAIPPGIEVVDVPANQKFSVAGLGRQVRAVSSAHRRRPFDVLHGWTARDWELTAAAGRWLRVPTAGLLHDHPEARAISRSRRALMRLSARFGLDRVLCVSRAVEVACREAGYVPMALRTIHNGIPLPPAPGRSPGGTTPPRMGFLGVFTERKGLRLLFEIIARLGASTEVPWSLALAGEAQDAAGRELLAALTSRHSGAPWWSRLQWVGWQRDPFAFLADLDLLITPSSEFDPFPTVLLEAGAMGIPVFASRVGGVAEIVEEGRTGWTFDPARAEVAAALLARVLADPGGLATAGHQARARVEGHFGLARMARDYRALYDSLLATRGRAARS